MNTFAQQFLAEASEVISRLDTAQIENAARLLAETARMPAAVCFC